MVNTLVLERLADERYQEVDLGGIGISGRVSEWLKDYFSVNEDLQDFVRRNDEDGLEIMKTDGSKGYVFIGPLQLNRNYESRMNEIRKRFETMGRRTLRYFVDKEAELAGFSWKKGYSS